MPSFQDSAVIFFLALLLFGPKKLPELARYVGKLMGEFRRASSEFRLQMEDEFRQSEQVEQQKKIAAIEAAAPLAPALDIPEPEHPHTPPPMSADEVAEVSEQPLSLETTPANPIEPIPEHHIDARISEPAPAPLPIATAGELQMMPPATGLPVRRGGADLSIGSMFHSIPKAPPQPETPEPANLGTADTEAHVNG